MVRSRLAPPLSQAEEIYLQSLSDVAGGLLGGEAAGAPQGSALQQLAAIPQLLLNPTAQVRRQALGISSINSAAPHQLPPYDRFGPCRTPPVRVPPHCWSR